MPVLDVIDETFILAPASDLVDELVDERRWRSVGLHIEPFEDRGLRGRRWRLTGDFVGTAEVWLESTHGGVIVHLFVQADPVRSTSRRVLERRIRHPLKRWVLDLKRRHDLHRPAGTSLPPATTMEADAPQNSEET